MVGRGEFSVIHFPQVPQGITADSVRRSVGDIRSRKQEAQMMSFVVSDVVSLARQKGNQRRLYNALLPSNKARLQVASEILHDSSQDREIREIIAAPLFQILSPASGKKWYARLASAEQIAQLNEPLMQGFEHYESQQQYASKNEIGEQLTEFVTGIAYAETVIDTLQTYVSSMQYQRLTFSPQIDRQIAQALYLLDSLPVGNLRAIASHPIGKEVLDLYAYIDILKQFPREIQIA